MTKARGGKREGAGRKPTGRNTKVLRLDADLADYLSAFLKVHSSAEVMNRLQQINTEPGSGGAGEQGSKGAVGATASASEPDGETKNPVGECFALTERLGDEEDGSLPGPIEDVEVRRAKAQLQTPTLNSDQQRAIALLTRWWNGNERMASLSGAAGTGKTFTQRRQRTRHPPPPHLHSHIQSLGAGLFSVVVDKKSPFCSSTAS
ncbi:hypothetical protein [[Phormidium] sp. ETS-05]|uniref:hypothetical protein n=1 Tax=[Phormidium] sp. ETS-05 TaxID=222819 RepID=UPI0018EEE38D|nr:hypothetical protein [[Phormidium] sp. ETS-05]